MEGCGYRDLQSDFDALGVEIVGVSYSPVSLADYWVDREGFEFELWLDDDKTLSLALGAASSSSALYCERVSFLLDPDGNVVLEYVESVATGTHPYEVLADIGLLLGGG